MGSYLLLRYNGLCFQTSFFDQKLQNVLKQFSPNNVTPNRDSETAEEM